MKNNEKRGAGEIVISIIVFAFMMLMVITVTAILNFFLWPDEAMAEGLGPHRENFIENSEYNGQKEIKFQISLGSDLFDIYGVKGSVSYTQRSYWSIYDEKDSRPFRESNYNPRVFLNYTRGPVKTSAGYWHESNGGKEAFTRSWDRYFIESDYTKDAFKGRLILWDVFMTEHDNIKNIAGKGSLYMRYDFGVFQISQETGLSYYKVKVKIPSLIFDNLDSTYTFRSGKLDSLIDYDKNITRHSIGFSLGGE